MRTCEKEAARKEQREVNAGERRTLDSCSFSPHVLEFGAYPHTFLFLLT